MYMCGLFSDDLRHRCSHAEASTARDAKKPDWAEAIDPCCEIANQFWHGCSRKRQQLHTIRRGANK